MDKSRGSLYEVSILIHAVDLVTNVNIEAEVIALVHFLRQYYLFFGAWKFFALISVW